MSRRFRNYPIHEPLLLPEDLNDWLPEDHLARFISETIESIDLSSFFRAYETAHGRGQPPYHPAMMLKLWLYGYATGVNSSRKLERATYENVAFRFLAANLHPDHDSLAAFRVRHADGMKAAFVEVLTCCREMGLASLGAVAVDGSKFKANASLKNSIAHTDIDQRLAAQQRRFDELFAETDKAESSDNQEDPHRLPRPLANAAARLAKLKEAKKKVDAAKNKAELEQKLDQEKRASHKGKKSESRAQNAKTLRDLRKSKGLSQTDLCGLTGLTHQALSKIELGKRAPTSAQIQLLARELGDCVLELTWPPSRPQEEKKEPVSQAVPRVNLTDDDSRVMKLRDKAGTIQGYNAQIAVDFDHQIIVAAEVVNNANDQGLMPGMIAQCEENTGKNPEAATADCGYYGRKTIKDPRLHGVELYVPPRRSAKESPEITAMRAKLASSEGKAIYKKRAHTVEPIFARIKNSLGFRCFKLRGLIKVNLEFNLLATACNLLKLHRYSA